MEYKQKSVVRDISESLGKLPPQALDLEEAVLGALMLEKHAMVEVASVLKIEHLYSEQHQEIYKSMIDLFGEGEKIDMRTVVAKLRKNGKLELVGGAYYIAELTSKVSSAANIEYHCRIIIELAMKRSLIQLASTVHSDAYEDTTDVFDIITRLELDIQSLLDRAIGSKVEKSAKDLSFKFIKETEARMAGKHGGIRTGFYKYDQLMDGLHKTDLIIIAARPGVGKSCFALQIGKQVAQSGVPVAVFSLEMSGEQLIGRLTIAESEIDSGLAKTGALNNLEFQRLMDGAGKISSLPLWIDDTPAIGIVELRARAIRLKTKYNIGLLIVDYLQLIKGVDGGQRGITRDQEIGIITRTLKLIAKELDIPVIALSQLSRAVETRGGDKRPQLSDLRESGSQEQDADIIAFIYRPEIYKINLTEDGQSTHGLAEIIIAKHRGGATDTIRQKFIGKHQRFTEWVNEFEPLRDQSTYISKHVKNVLPSERTPEDLNSSDTPF
jgi:replicative DNA helicase